VKNGIAISILSSNLLMLFISSLLVTTSCQKIDEEVVDRLTNTQSSSEASEETDTPIAGDSVFVTSFSTKYHIPALSDTLDDGSIHFKLLSLMEWGDIKLSSYSESALNDIVASYAESSLSGWHIPTKEEAALLRDNLLLKIETFNNDIISLGGAPLSSSTRYMCASFDSTFAFKEKSTISKAGQKTGYKIRLVKDTVVIRRNYKINFN